ncbi:MAG TPA: UDP-N-acetylglucosamine--N-acetylmuramyl-(pentapeptide) pyrophosphoryl-undecaprenol N-acetylglucosamine transferase [Candidatus Saccharimonadales bacterium]|nr:UDP-N-acetylglucosamine--N-acetylmuramyl-(pentapeptide) pyrophosphoryl-undecaprenol N-acetylglucosamine transferase [Candidatus Saccharimonadales bacterium]
MKIVIIGGHFTPALAVIEGLDKKSNIIYFGRKYTFENDKTESLEYQTITKRGIQFVPIITGRLQRKFTPKTIPSLAKIPYGFFQALSLLRKYKPDSIMGFGGYLSVPVCLAGRLLGIPVIIHEQTLEAGLANKFIAQFAAKICISWPSSINFFPKQKTVLTGNPLPTSMFNNISNDAKRYDICIIGGSAGSHAINVLIEECLPELLEKYTIFHQTGNAQEFQDYDRIVKLKETLPEKLQKRYTIVKYIEPEQFISVLKEADLVISRCGINTITVLLQLQKRSLLIPLPFSQRQEQYKNALLLQRTGLGEIIEQQALTSKILFDKIAFIFNNKKTYEKKVVQIEKTDPLSATQKIITIITDISQKNTKAKIQTDS